VPDEVTAKMMAADVAAGYSEFVECRNLGGRVDFVGNTAHTFSDNFGGLRLDPMA
jgi:hypothetical protein